MSRVEELEAEVAKLSDEEVRAFRAWFEEHYADLVDRWIEEDVRAGRFDQMAKQALADYEAGRCTEL